MKPWQHILVSVAVLVLSQIGYYYAFLSNEITMGCDALSEVKRCDNPFAYHFDIFKSSIQVFISFIWMLLGYSVARSASGIAIAFFWFWSAWNEFADYLWGESYIFKTDEIFNLGIGVFISITLFIIWRKKLIAQ